MEDYQITGMSCAACSARVEQAVRQVAGVTDCQVNLLANSMRVTGTASSETVISAVEAAGYGARLAHDSLPLTDETKPVKRRFLWSLGLLLVLLYFSMGYQMAHLPLPAVITIRPIWIGWIQFSLSLAVMVLNRTFFISGTKGVLHKAPNMDTLVALGAGAAFLYSAVMLILMMKTGTDLLHDLYFETAGMILTLITLGKMLEARAKGKTTNALAQLVNYAPKTATVRRNGAEVKVPISEVKVGDIVLVHAGEHIPADATVVSGNGAVDESMLTGESIPVDKTVGSKVSAATVNQSGFMECEVTKVGEDTAFSQIVRAVQEASQSKAPIARIADKAAGVFVPIVILVAGITFITWLLLKETVGFSLARAISVLVISCPCALGLATPVAIMVGSGKAAKYGILFKNGTALEEAGKVRSAALDKTGTVTLGTPVVTDLFPAEGVSESALITYAASLEQKSEHPLSKAVRAEAEKQGISLYDVTDFENIPGKGLSANWEGERLMGGNRAFLSDLFPQERTWEEKMEVLSGEGKTPLLFAKGQAFLGMIAVADAIRPDAASAISDLKKMGIRAVLISGDHRHTAQAVGKKVGIEQIISEVLPEEKQAEIKRLSQNGKVAMVGDGINDAPALKQADVGIAMGSGTDIAALSADVVLIHGTLRSLPAAFELSRKVIKNIKENLFWAFFYNIIGIPLAAGVWIPVFGWKLSPMFGAAAMSVSSLFVVSNALRLNTWKPKFEKEKKTMKYSMKIDGMMCGHCEARVKEGLEALPEVTDANVSHKTGMAILTLSKDVEPSRLKETVEHLGYRVLD